MNRFARLFRALDETTSTNRKVAALVDYFTSAPADDSAWCVFFLSGRRFRRAAPVGALRGWAADAAGIPDWLFDECYEAVGDLAETMALLVPAPASPTDRPLDWWVREWLLPFRDAPESMQRELLHRAWEELRESERFLLHKLMTGGFRVGVSQRLVTRALARVAGIDPAAVAHRLMGDWEPGAASFERLIAANTDDTDPSRPYPFFLAHQLTDTVESLGPPSAWQAEWKWDGIRFQIVRRGNRTYPWSRGGELVRDRFPEIDLSATHLPDGLVLDGEVVGWRDGVLPFASLQRRLNRKRVTRRLLDEVPVVFLAFDILEYEGRDVRDRPLDARRHLLDEVLGKLPGDGAIRTVPVLAADSWEALAALRGQSRTHGTEGLMLKRRDSAYGVGRTRGDWWKWKVDPYSVDAVLVYAQRGHGRRASLYSDYTFAVWDDGALVPFAKAYSGLTNDEIAEVDRFVRRNTLERFGPVRRVEPQLVFELAFEDIRPSSRHKSGLAVRFPRMVRWRRDKGPAEADTIDRIRDLLPDRS